MSGLPGRISARELVRLRVREEVARFNADRADDFRGLVRPTDAEATLNGCRVGRSRRPDWERQEDAACAAFARNGFVLLVDDRQAEDLDEDRPARGSRGGLRAARSLVGG
ncbi:hypothetical protein ACWEH1_15445 [Micromonospora chersina]